MARPSFASYVALLRGINVGGKNIVPMAELGAIFGELGCDGVRTYIQSGNVLFRAGAGLAKKVPALAAKRIATAFGHDVTVVVRTAEEIAAVRDANPFIASGADERALYVAFLADEPSARSVAALDPNRSPPDAFVVRGREIYLHLPNGAARTKITNAYLDAKLATTSTVRNWRTVVTLSELATESHSRSTAPSAARSRR